MSSSIGREHEKAILRQLLSARLLTLTGSGGAAKGRLALEVAAEVAKDFPDGVWWVNLARLADFSLVTPAVASALGVREQPGRPILATLEDFLQSRRLLVIRNNCGHVLEACVELVSKLLHSYPDISILTTSRKPLRIGGEFTYRVPSPDEGTAP